MLGQLELNGEVRESSANNQPVKVGVLPLFSTWIWVCENGPTHLNQTLQDLAHRLATDDRFASVRTNSGGWHYACDLFKLNEPVVTEFHGEMEEHVQAFLNYFRPEARKKD